MFLCLCLQISSFCLSNSSSNVRGRDREDNPFGVLAFLSWNHTWNNFKYPKKDLKKAVKLLKELGVSFVRVDFYWQDIEPQKGKFDFSKYDYIVKLISENNIKILAILDYCADWAGKSWNSPPDNLDDFVNFARKVVQRYKEKIKYWEIWNEPDSRIYWQPQDEMKTYLKLLKKTYKAIKEIDPSAKILLGGLTPEGYYALKRIYEMGGKDYFDIVNIHPFVNPLEKDCIKRIKILCKNIKKLMEKFGDKEKKIWITEIGCPGVKKPSKENAWWFGKSPTEAEQAEFLKKVFTEIPKLEFVDKVFWAFFRDCKEHFNTGVDFFGLVRWDFSRKKAFKIYKKCILNWEKQKYKKQIKVSQKNQFERTF